MACECDHSETIKRMNKTLYGNGEPEKALVTVVHGQEEKLSNIDKRTARIEKIAWTVALAIGAWVGSQMLGQFKIMPNLSPAAIESTP